MTFPSLNTLTAQFFYYIYISFLDFLFWKDYVMIMGKMKVFIPEFTFFLHNYIQLSFHVHWKVSNFRGSVKTNYESYLNNLRVMGMGPLSGEATLSKLFSLHIEKVSIVKGKKWLSKVASSYLLALTPFQRDLDVKSQSDYLNALLFGQC